MWPWIIGGALVISSADNSHRRYLENKRLKTQLALATMQKIEEEDKAKYEYLLELEKSCLTSDASQFCQLQSSLKVAEQALALTESAIEEADERYDEASGEYNRTLNRLCDSEELQDFCQLRNAYLSSNKSISDIRRRPIRRMFNDFYTDWMGVSRVEDDFDLLTIGKNRWSYEGTFFDGFDFSPDGFFDISFNDNNFPLEEIFIIANEMATDVVREMGYFKRYRMDIKDGINDPVEIKSLKKKFLLDLRESTKEGAGNLRNLKARGVCDDAPEQYYCYLAILTHKVYLDLAAFYWPSAVKVKQCYLNVEEYLGRNQNIEFIEIDESAFSQFETLLNDYNAAVDESIGGMGDKVFSELLKEFGEGIKFDRQSVENLENETNRDVLLKFFDLFFNDEEEDQNIERVIARAAQVKKEHIAATLLYIPALNKLCAEESAPDFCRLRSKAMTAREELFVALERYNEAHEEWEAKEHDFISFVRDPCEIDASSVYCLTYSDKE